MGRVTKLMGMIKDKASQSKAALMAKPHTLSFHLALLRATTHDPFSPPNPKHIATLLSFGKTSRATAAAALEVLMDRLQTTNNSAVALKCLLAVHTIIKNGAFILQDQLSVFPFSGGRNYLNLSDFRDASNPILWDLSSWVRWYAQYVETLLSTSRILGFFVGSSSSVGERERNSGLVSAILNSDLLRETESLVDLIEQSCNQPNYLHFNGNKLVEKILGLVVEDYMTAVREISARVGEFHERLSCLSFGESVELVCTLKRLENCREKQLNVSAKYEIVTDGFWGLVKDTENMVGGMKENSGGGKLGICRSGRCESARFKERARFYRDPVQFGSARYDKNLPVVDSTTSYKL